MRSHESNIKYWQKHPRNPVAQHFGTKKLQPKDYTLEILDQESDKNKRNRLEEAWIYLLNSMTPSGLNSKMVKIKLQITLKSTNQLEPTKIVTLFMHITHTSTDLNEIKPIQIQRTYSN